MELMTHQWFSMKCSIAAIGDENARKMFCEGQFVVLPTVVLCFVEVGQTTDDSHLSSPSEVVWRPKLDLDFRNLNEWFPEQAREVWDRSGTQVRKIKDHHVFLRAPGEEQYLYAGEAHLGSYGDTPTGRSQRSKAACFSLRQKLPRDVWLRMGGYPGWLVEVNHKTHQIATGDSATFERLVSEQERLEFSHLCMTRYEEDSLTVHTNPNRGWLMYLRHPGDAGLYTWDRDYRESADTKDYFRCVCGIDLEFSAAETLPRELAMRAVMEFFQTGGLPTCVPWDQEVP